MSTKLLRWLGGAFPAFTNPASKQAAASPQMAGTQENVAEAISGVSKKGPQQAKKAAAGTPHSTPAPIPANGPDSTPAPAHPGGSQMPPNLAPADPRAEGAPPHGAPALSPTWRDPTSMPNPPEDMREQYAKEVMEGTPWFLEGI